MRYISKFEEELEVFSALGSEVRVSILNLLIKNGRMSMNDLAQALDLSNGALTPHIRKLEGCGLIRVNTDISRHGNLKICEPHLEKILFVFSGNQQQHNEFRSHLRVGQYSSCSVYPTCGLSSADSLIGDVDDPRYFTHWKHYEADILWFTKGYVEYMIPCVIPRHSRIEQISVSMELSSEAPGSNPYWPSDLHFYLNGTLLGVWTSPGDFADVPGLFTPEWWFPNWNQYGLIKTLEIRSDGTFMDDLKISPVTIGELNVTGKAPMYLRIAVPDAARHIGGLTLFGRDFGNYNQDIEFRILYSV
jgi:predicted transcriptional regulator